MSSLLDTDQQGADQEGAEQEKDAHEAMSPGLSASCHAVLPCWPF
jgi:hypothetical protein